MLHLRPRPYLAAGLARHMQLPNMQAVYQVESSVPLKDKRQKVESVIQQLNLDTCRHVRIGNAESRGISGMILVELPHHHPPRELTQRSCQS